MYGWYRFPARFVVKEIKLDVTLILKIAGIGTLVSVVHQVLSRYGREEQATMVAVAGVVLVLFILVEEMSELFSTVRDLFGI